MRTLARLVSALTVSTTARVISAAAAGALLLAALAPAPARAQELPRPAEDFVASKSHGPVPKGNVLRALRGRVVMLVLLNAWSERCGEASVFLNKFHDKYGPLGLTVVGVFEGDFKPIVEFVTKHEIQFGVILADTNNHDKVKHAYPFPGEPWCHLIDATGQVVYSEHPQNPATERQIKPLLAASYEPPRVPEALAALQAPLDGGLWAEARTAALALAETEGLDKTMQGWAKGIAEWVETRRQRTPVEAEVLVQEGAWWDAWDRYNDFPQRFAGMGGEDDATKRAEEIRATPEAADDLAAGDEVAKSAEFIANGKTKQAKIKLERLVKKYAGTRHGERAKTLLAKL